LGVGGGFSLERAVALGPLNLFDANLCARSVEDPVTSGLEAAGPVDDDMSWTMGRWSLHTPGLSLRYAGCALCVRVTKRFFPSKEEQA